MIKVRLVKKIEGVEVQNGDTITLGVKVGMVGASAYQSYLKTTTDNPPLSEAEWSAPFELTKQAVDDVIGVSEDGNQNKFYNELGNFVIVENQSQIQSDWDQTDEQEPDFIKNKPEIPTIPTIPTKTSELENDGQNGEDVFITINDIPTVTYVENSGHSETSDNANADSEGNVFQEFYEKLENKGQAGGYPSLDLDGLIPEEFILPPTKAQIDAAIGVDAVNGDETKFYNGKGQLVTVTGGGAVDLSITTIAAQAGAYTYTLENNKETLVTGNLPTAVTSTIALPAIVADKLNKSTVHLSVGLSLPTLAYLDFTPVWEKSDPIVFTSNRKYTLIFEQIDGIVKAKWEEYYIAIPEYTIRDNWVASYRMDNLDTTILNSVDATNSGTISGIYTLNQTGKINKAILCTNALITYNNTDFFTPNKPISYSIWIYPTNLTGLKLLIYKSSATAFEFTIRFNSGNLELNIGSGVSNTNSFAKAVSLASAGITANNWYHLGFSWDGGVNPSNAKIYVNGVLQTMSTTLSGTYTGTSNSVNACKALSYEGSYQFVGTFDQFDIFHKELNADEFAEIYNSGNGLEY